MRRRQGVAGPTSPNASRRRARIPSVPVDPVPRIPASSICEACGAVGDSRCEKLPVSKAHADSWDVSCPVVGHEVEVVAPGPLPSTPFRRNHGHLQSVLLVPKSYPLGNASSCIADHLGAAVAVVDVGADLDHARQARVVGRGDLFGSGAPQAADDGHLDRRARCRVHAVPDDNGCRAHGVRRGETRVGGRVGR
jgi:hypothetical protein